MKQTTNSTTDSAEVKRYQARLRYYHKVIGLPLEEAKKKAGPQNGSAPAQTTEGGDQPMTEWKRRQLAKQKLAEAKIPHRLWLKECPFCEAAFFRRVNKKYLPIKMCQCEACNLRFFWYKGLIEE